jgi:uncharacterized protein
LSNDIEYLPSPMPLECRGDSRTVGGYALRFGSVSADLGGFSEVVDPSFCDQASAARFAGVVCRYNHDSNLLLGAVDNNTLRCAVDPQGLDYSCDIPEYHDWVLQSIRRGDVRHSSFSFRLDGPNGDRWERRDGKPLRVLLSGTILETAPTPIPAYPQGTTVALRSLAYHMAAPLEDVQRLAESRSLDKFFVRSDRPPAPSPAPQYTGRDGKQALAETMGKRPVFGRSRLIQTLDESPKAVAARVSVPEALRRVTEAARPPVIAMVEVSIAEAMAITELESSRRRLAEAETRSEVAEPLSGTEARSAYQPMSGHEALRQTMAMQQPESPRNPGRAYDAYLSES